MSNVDPWAHRSAGMRCQTCMWFASKPGGQLGRCRRHAPTMNGYPVVYPADWCGDHKLDETKLVNQVQSETRAPQVTKQQLDDLIKRGQAGAGIKSEGLKETGAEFHP